MQLDALKVHAANSLPQLDESLRRFSSRIEPESSQSVGWALLKDQLLEQVLDAARAMGLSSDELFKALGYAPIQLERSE